MNELSEKTSARPNQRSWQSEEEGDTVALTPLPAHDYGVVRASDMLHRQKGVWRYVVWQVTEMPLAWSPKEHGSGP